MHSNTNTVSATADMHSWLEWDFSFVFCGSEMFEASNMLNVFTEWFLHHDVLPEMQIIAQFVCMCVWVCACGEHYLIWLLAVCSRYANQSQWSYQSGVFACGSVPVQASHRCSCSGWLGWKRTLKRTNFITWKCFSNLDISYCRYTTGWRCFLLGTATVAKNVSRYSAELLFSWNNFLTLVVFCLFFL